MPAWVLKLRRALKLIDQALEAPIRTEEVKELATEQLAAFSDTLTVLRRELSDLQARVLDLAAAEGRRP